MAPSQREQLLYRLDATLATMNNSGLSPDGVERWGKLNEIRDRVASAESDDDAAIDEAQRALNGTSDYSKPLQRGMARFLDSRRSGPTPPM